MLGLPAAQSQATYIVGVKRLYRILEYSLGVSETIEYSDLFRVFEIEFSSVHPFYSMHSRTCVILLMRYATDLPPLTRHPCDILCSLLASPLSDLMLATWSNAVACSMDTFTGVLCGWHTILKVSVILVYSNTRLEKKTSTRTRVFVQTFTPSI